MLLGSITGHAINSIDTPAHVVDLTSPKPTEEWSRWLPAKWKLEHYNSAIPNPVAESTKYAIPGRWEVYSDDNDLSCQHTATHTLEILLPKGQRQYHLFIPALPSAHELWVNNQLVSSQGVVGTSKRDEQPGIKAKSVVVTPNDKGRLHLTLHTSNYQCLISRRATPFHISTSETSIPFWQVSLSIFAFTYLIALSIYHIFFFFLRPKPERPAFYFGLFCIVLGIHGLFVGDRVIYQMLPGLNWDYLQKLELMLYIALPTLFSHFLYSFYPKQVPIAIPKSTHYVAIFAVTIALFLPPESTSQFIPAYLLWLLLMCFWSLYVLAKIVRSKTRGSLVFVVSISLLTAVLIADILLPNSVVGQFPLDSLGTFLFAVIHSFAFLGRFSNTVTKMERLSGILKSQNKKLKEVSSMKDEFLANTSHELRTPIHSMVGIAQTLLKQNNGPINSKQREDLKLIINSGQRLGHLVNDVLDFSKLKNKETSITMAPLELSSAILCTLALLKPLADKKQLELIYRPSEDLRLVEADEERLQQILFNLIGNAIKFTPSGLIEVCTRMEADKVKVSICDTGIGIPDSFIEWAVEPFSQAEGSISRAYCGAGLGLAISKQLLELHDSQMLIEKDDRFETCISFYLKISDKKECPQVSQFSKSELVVLNPITDESTVFDTLVHSSDSYKGTLLAVDDDPANLRVISNQFEAIGYRVATALNGVEGLEKVEEVNPDIILVDLMMPELNGLDLCRYIRKDFSQAELPIIILTARNQSEDLIKGFESGANDYLTKPFSQEELHARVINLIRFKKACELENENVLLKEEIDKRIKAEQNLQNNHDRLLMILDSYPDPIILTNDSLVIKYVNTKAWEQISEIKFSINESLINYVKNEPDLNLNELTDNEHGSLTLLFDGLVVKKVSTFQSGEIRYLLYKLEANTNPEAPANCNNEVLEVLDSAFKSLTDSLGRLNLPTQKHVEFVSPVDTIDEKNCIVSLMQLSLKLWESASGKDKIKLADESKLWRIYLDQGTAKTRTMDKYFYLDQLPAKPRWRTVLKTAEYVYEHCQLQSSDAQMLNDKIRELGKLKGYFI